MTARERAIELLAAELRGPSLAAAGKAGAMVDAVIEAVLEQAVAAPNAGARWRELVAVNHVLCRENEKLVRARNAAEARVVELEAALASATVKAGGA